MKEAVFEVFLENLRTYTEGGVAGRWISLPQDREELERIVREIAGKNQDELIILDSSARKDCAYLNEFIGEWSSMEELNALAWLIGEELHPKVQEAVQAYLTNRSTSPLTEIANLILQEEEIPFVPYEFEGSDNPEVMDRLSEEEKMGYTMVEGNPELKDMLKSQPLGTSNLMSYIDVEAIGRDLSLSEYVSLSEEGYLDVRGYSPDLSRYTMEEIWQEVADREKQDGAAIILTVAEYRDFKENKESAATKQISLPQGEEDLQEQVRDLTGTERQTGLVITDCSFTGSGYLEKFLPELPCYTIMQDDTVGIAPEYNDIGDWNMLAKLMGDVPHSALESYLEVEGKRRGYGPVYNPLELSNLLRQERELLTSGSREKMLYTDWYSREEIWRGLYEQNPGQQESEKTAEKMVRPPFVLFMDKEDVEEDYTGSRSWNDGRAYRDDGQDVVLVAVDIEMPQPQGTLQNMIENLAGPENRELKDAHIYDLRNDCRYISHLVNSDLVESDAWGGNLEELADWNTLGKLIGDEYHPEAKAYARVYLTEGRRLTVPEFANLLMQEKELPYTPGQRPDLHEYNPNLSRYTMEEIQQELAEREQRRQEPEQKAVQDQEKKEDRGAKERKAKKEQQHIPVSPSL